MRGDAELRRPVHLVCSNLDLVKTAARTEDRRVQGAVHVGLGRRDVVVESLGQRCPLVVNHSQRMVAVLDGLYLHPDRHQVIDLLVRLATLDDLVVNRPEVLRPARNLTGDAGFFQLFAQRLAQLLNPVLPLPPPLTQLLRELPVGRRLQHLEGEILELPADLRHPQPVSERRVDVSRFQGDALLLAGRQRLERPHVMKPVRQLHDDHTGVPGHRDQ